MNAYSTSPPDIAYADPAPVFIAASNDAALERAVRTVEGFGLRTAGRCLLGDAADRLALQASASAVWMELDGGVDPTADQAVDALAREASAERFGAVVSAPSSMIDPIAARLGDQPVELVIDGGEEERTAALAVALARNARGARLSDIAADRDAARLRQLSDEVSRIASTLARLSAGPAGPAPQPAPAMTSDAPAVSADVIREVIRARRLRNRFFAEDLFADPAWDMLLDLLQAEIAHLRVPVSSLCIAAAVPATTALRWLKTMVDQGLFLRRADPHDGRRVFVELAPDTSAAMRRYFAELGKRPAVI